VTSWKRPLPPRGSRPRGGRAASPTAHQVAAPASEAETQRRAPRLRRRSRPALRRARASPRPGALLPLLRAARMASAPTNATSPPPAARESAFSSQPVEPRGPRFELGVPPRVRSRPAAKGRRPRLPARSCPSRRRAGRPRAGLEVVEIGGNEALRAPAVSPCGRAAPFLHALPGLGRVPGRFAGHPRRRARPAAPRAPPPARPRRHPPPPAGGAKIVVPKATARSAYRVGASAARASSRPRAMGPGARSERMKKATSQRSSVAQPGIERGIGSFGLRTWPTEDSLRRQRSCFRLEVRRPGLEPEREVRVSIPPRGRHRTTARRPVCPGARRAPLRQQDHVEPLHDLVRALLARSGPPPPAARVRHLGGGASSRFSRPEHAEQIAFVRGCGARASRRT